MSTLFQNIASCVVHCSFLSATPWIVSLFLAFDTPLIQRQEKRSLSSYWRTARRMTKQIESFFYLSVLAIVIDKVPV